VVIYPLLACLAWKWLQIGTDKLLNITTTCDVLLRIVNIDDLDWPWTPKIGVFSDFYAIFGYKRGNCNEMDRERPRFPANRNCYRLSRISWALAQISCLVFLMSGFQLFSHTTICFWIFLCFTQQYFHITFCHFSYHIVSWQQQQLLLLLLPPLLLTMKPLCQSTSWRVKSCTSWYFHFTKPGNYIITTARLRRWTLASSTYTTTSTQPGHRSGELTMSLRQLANYTK